ncbi:hypothetical protein BSNK01_22830 [Bacillaceae bacterium]
MKKRFLIPIFLGTMLILSACSSSEGDTANTDSGNQGATTEPVSLNIEAKNWSFNEDKFVIKAGQPVKINLKNTEGMHGLAIDEFGVNIQGDGEAEFTPDKPGEYTIYCSIPCGNGHADMKATLVVE